MNNNKRKPTDTPSPNKPLNDSGSKQYSLPPTRMQPCSNQYPTQYTQNLNDTPLSSNVLSSSRQVLYGADNGYAFTPYHLQAPNTTPAQMGQQKPSMPIPMHSISNPFHLDLLQFMPEVKVKLQKLDILEDIFSRPVNMESHCHNLNSDICGIKTEIKDHTSNIASLDKGLSGLHLELQEIETQNMSLSDENYKLQEKIIDQQKRSMRKI
ncbi:unnamed protein product [Mytilus coruscus]|uniref:Uncharacterized protein n=1 Tax=Mytilus coruscus TaxID=42192 RepID=A0A6J8AHJ0_MYTCO|nr:unnamed protein product [Mytilus coruscus]